MSVTPLIHQDNYYLKREDQNLTGSAKDRAIRQQIESLINRGQTSAVISSTGNAAISAAYFCRQQGIKLTVFISPHINPQKQTLIKPADIVVSANPIKAAFQFSRQTGAFFLRQSTDPSALIGYQTIGRELIDQLPQITSIFIPIGSGTTLLGISQSLPPTVKVFAVQSNANPTITHYFDPPSVVEKKLLTDALSVKYLPLKKEILTAINQSDGSGITVANAQILAADSQLQSRGIITSYEGALALSGFNQALAKNLNPGPFPVILLTGARR